MIACRAWSSCPGWLTMTFFELASTHSSSCSSLPINETTLTAVPWIADITVARTRITKIMVYVSCIVVGGRSPMTMNRNVPNAM